MATFLFLSARWQWCGGGRYGAVSEESPSHRGTAVDAKNCHYQGRKREKCWCEIGLSVTSIARLSIGLSFLHIGRRFLQKIREKLGYVRVLSMGRRSKVGEEKTNIGSKKGREKEINGVGNWVKSLQS